MKRLSTAVVTVTALVAADQAIKIGIEQVMDYHQRIDLLPFFALFLTHNPGIAFSMLSGAGPLPLIGLSLAVSAFVTWLWASSPPERRLAHIGFALIIGGAIGNLIDRVLYGYVIDYFLFHTPGWSFAIFNLADAAITIGAGLVILDEVLAWQAARKSERKGEDE
ncbi:MULTISPECIES: signal peptidase II [unclassified Roseitalea]|uniref:signal peptidase II n=1 Tax=unclassified Roseitalea TaxID=2639107 RepID=UPI00273D3A17|nr:MULTISPECIES: signal peptidase II [unclassified Roseitalea]